MNLEEKRIKLFQLFRKKAVENEIGKKFDAKYATFDIWQSVNFKNEATVLILWDKSLKEVLNATTKEDFFKTFACDLLPTSNYCIQEGFPKCASLKGTAVASGFFGFGDKHIDYTTTLWDKPQIRLSQASDGKPSQYEVLTGGKKGQKGIYRCIENRLLLIEPTDASTPTPTPTETNTPTPTETSTSTPITKSGNNKVIYGTDAIIY
jgi:hypothetical protein